MALEKLKAALGKANKRFEARSDDEQEAFKKTRRLNREIKDLRDQIDALVITRQKTENYLQAERDNPRPDPKVLARFEQLLERQEEDIQDAVAKVKRKVGKRSSWRKRRKKAQKRAAWWLRRRTVLRKQYKAAKEKWDKEHALDFQPWMLNGCAGNVSSEIKEVIAYVVVVCGQYVTSTTGGTHAPGSYHYSGRAVDWGAGSVSSMQDASNKTREHFGDSHFAEFFSPCPWWIKYGAVYSGYFPGHGDHGHTAV